ncbi:hypothetical protein ACQCVA_11035 [Bacillus infantis]|uniref:hypothetical protein n=1 Tax=Bacillus infantis TaxID=324767 RepID=UPI003CE84CA8
MLRSGYIFYDQWSFLKKQEFDFTGAGIPHNSSRHGFRAGSGQVSAVSFLSYRESGNSYVLSKK